MSYAFQLNSGSNTQSRFNLDNTYDALNGVTPEILGYQPAPIKRMAYDRVGNCVYMVFGTKLWKGRLGGTPNVDLLWSRKPLANGGDVVVDIGGFRSFGSMDTCGCKVAIAHWYSFDKKVTIYDIDSDTFEILLIDTDNSHTPFYACCGFADNEILYVEFTSSSYEDKHFYAVYPNKTFKRLADPPQAAAVSFVWAQGYLWRLDTVSDLQRYDPVTDTWQDMLPGISGFGVALNLHKLDDDEFIALSTGSATPAFNTIKSYHISTNAVTTTRLTSAPQAYGGGASFVYSEPTGIIDFDGCELTLCICVKLERQDGITMGFTTHDKQLIIDGLEYRPIDSVQATAVRHELGTGIDNLDVQGLLHATVLSSDYITETELRAGTYDGARVNLYIVDWLEPSRTPDTIITGSTGEIQIMQGKYVAEVRGLLQRMSQQVGELTSATCRVKRLGDARCKVDMTPFRKNSDVASVQGPRLISFNDNFPSGFYDYGVVEVTSGANVGLSREIKNNVFNFGTLKNDISLQEAFPYAFVPGDTVILEAGCDRTLQRCIDKFDNILNFRGEPNIPGTDQLLKVGKMA